MSMRKEPGNYRAMSLTSVPGKVMQKVVLGNTERQLKKKAIIRHSQHGFLKRKSCLSNLIYNMVTCLVDEENAVDVICLHFSKAFDTVPPSILLDKLSICRINRFVLVWVMN